MSTTACVLITLSSSQLSDVDVNQSDSSKSETVALLTQVGIPEAYLPTIVGGMDDCLDATLTSIRHGINSRRLLLLLAKSYGDERRVYSIAIYISTVGFENSSLV